MFKPSVCKEISSGNVMNIYSVYSGMPGGVIYEISKQSEHLTNSNINLH